MKNTRYFSLIMLLAVGFAACSDPIEGPGTEEPDNYSNPWSLMDSFDVVHYGQLSITSTPFYMTMSPDYKLYVPSQGNMTRYGLRIKRLDDDSLREAWETPFLCYTSDNPTSILFTPNGRMYISQVIDDSIKCAWHKVEDRFDYCQKDYGSLQAPSNNYASYYDENEKTTYVYGLNETSKLTLYKTTTEGLAVERQFSNTEKLWGVLQVTKNPKTGKLLLFSTNTTNQASVIELQQENNTLEIELPKPAINCQYYSIGANNSAIYFLARPGASNNKYLYFKQSAQWDSVSVPGNMVGNSPELFMNDDDCWIVSDQKISHSKSPFTDWEICYESSNEFAYHTVYRPSTKELVTLVSEGLYMRVKKHDGNGWTNLPTVPKNYSTKLITGSTENEICLVQLGPLVSLLKYTGTAWQTVVNKKYSPSSYDLFFGFMYDNRPAINYQLTNKRYAVYWKYDTYEDWVELPAIPREGKFFAVNNAYIVVNNANRPVIGWHDLEDEFHFARFNGTQWDDAGSIPCPREDRYLRAMVIDNSNRVYVMFENNDVIKMYQNSDEGATWTDMSYPSYTYGGFPAIALDANDQLWAVSNEVSVIRPLKYTGSSWEEGPRKSVTDGGPISTLHLAFGKDNSAYLCAVESQFTGQYNYHLLHKKGSNWAYKGIFYIANLTFDYYQDIRMALNQENKPVLLMLTHSGNITEYSRYTLR